MLLTEFKRLVDAYQPTLSSSDLGIAYEILNLDTSDNISSKNVFEALYSSIYISISLKEKSSENDIKRHKLINFRDELIYNYVLYGEDPIEYLKVIDVINDSCRKETNYFTSFDEIEKWQIAITNCKNYNIYCPTTFSTSLKNLRENYPKQYDIALSVNSLIQQGCKVEIRDSQINVTEGFEKVVEGLDLMIKELGGITVIRSIFNHLSLSNQYSQRFERYFMPRRTSGLAHDQRPQIPFGYILNIALKYPHENLSIKKPQSKLNEIIKHAIVITNGAYGVQHYSMWEHHFQSGDTMIKFCTDIALWDSLYNLPQSRPSTAIEIANKLFEYLDDQFNKTLGFSRLEMFEIINEIHKIEIDHKKITVIYVSKLIKRLKHIPSTTIQNVLNFIAHNDKVNEQYLLPSDYFHIDFFLKPLIQLGKTKFILMNESWCSPNYFESLASHFRKVLKLEKRDLDNELGEQLELFLQNKMKEKGITFCTGDYNVNGVHGECDLLIESDKSIVLIEFKKKPLTRKAKSGIDINIILDLVESILNAQIQAGRTDIFLREQDSIKLKSKEGEEFEIRLAGRNIERIALTQLEFGGFQDRTIINQFLTTFITHGINTSSTDTTIINKFKKLVDKQKVWVEQYDKLFTLDKSFAHFPFFNCWFLSLPQLLEIISLSIDNNSFLDVLIKTKHVSMNTLDWYYEFNYTNHLDNKKNN
ncbi:hypothetical protein SY27_07760 [Flavobacterium sp. 316]|uniref:hypothetical protein n=1 Tax=Flavobacterium sp. 316 TaxID=1603293 RepID=UPI0005E7E677|nr:hypothetical protein [Flavobacterium sp. 316]KIX21585.1 hypothetical protein SY27_07760 [Flavobacterium sp. 316]